MPNVKKKLKIRNKTPISSKKAKDEESSAPRSKSASRAPVEEEKLEEA
jgi:hypothetical protein